MRGHTVRSTRRLRPTAPASWGGGPLCPLRWASLRNQRRPGPHTRTAGGRGSVRAVDRCPLRVSAPRAGLDRVLLPRGGEGARRPDEGAHRPIHPTLTPNSTSVAGARTTVSAPLGIPPKPSPAGPTNQHHGKARLRPSYRWTHLRPTPSARSHPQDGGGADLRVRSAASPSETSAGRAHKPAPREGGPPCPLHCSFIRKPPHQWAENAFGPQTLLHDLAWVDGL
jgi:hypothetical protein